MDVDQVRAFLLTLPHVAETMQWGDNLVYWAGDKAIGGKMFALVTLDESVSHGVISYAAGQERYAELLETEGLTPAPYFARIFWIAAERWDVFRKVEWEQELRAAHALTLAKLPSRVHRALALPPKEYKRLVAEQSALQAGKRARRADAIPQSRQRHTSGSLQKK